MPLAIRAPPKLLLAGAGAPPDRQEGRAKAGPALRVLRVDVPRGSEGHRPPRSRLEKRFPSARCLDASLSADLSRRMAPRHETWTQHNFDGAKRPFATKRSAASRTSMSRLTG